MPPLAGGDAPGWAESPGCSRLVLKYCAIVADSLQYRHGNNRNAHDPGRPTQGAAQGCAASGERPVHAGRPRARLRRPREHDLSMVEGRATASRGHARDPWERAVKRSRPLKRRLAWVACPDCGAEHWARQYLRPEKGWAGSSYCPACQNERTKAWQRTIRTDVTWVCVACRNDYHPMNRDISHENAGRGIAHICGDECHKAWRRRLYPSDLCYAPVVGGCGRPRERDSHGWTSAYCQAHRKRKQRGTRIDTPVADYARSAS